MNIEKQFNSFKPLIKRLATDFSLKSGVPYDELVGVLSLEFYEKSVKFDDSRSKSFGAYIKPVLRQCATRTIQRSEGEHYRRVSFLEEQVKKTDHDDLTVDDLLSSGFDLEFEVISATARKTRQDKLQLIEHLMKDADELTTAIVKLMLAEPTATLTDIGERFGIHRSNVSRRLKGISRKYNADKFGDLSDYLAS